MWDAGQSQPPQHLSMFLEVSDGQSSGNWSCFVSHLLAIVNQRDTSRSLVKESLVIMLKSSSSFLALLCSCSVTSLSCIWGSGVCPCSLLGMLCRQVLPSK